MIFIHYFKLIIFYIQVYCDRGWSLAEDHIHYTVGRQCLNGQQIDGAAQALAALLKSGSQQTAAQQATYLNEFINVHQVILKCNSEFNCLANSFLNIDTDQTPTERTEQWDSSSASASTSSRC